MIIDTALPRVVAITPVGGTGQVLVTLQAGQSGLWLLPLLNPSNYLFTTARGASFHPTAVKPLASARSAAGQQSILLTPGSRARRNARAVSLSIASAGVVSQAGRALPGDVRASLQPTSGTL